MPIALVRSISLPNLKIYTTISLLLVSGCFYYAFDTVRTDPLWKLHQNTSHNYAISRSSAVLKQQQQQSSDVESESELTVNNVDILSSNDNSNINSKNINIDKSDVRSETNNIEEKLQSSFFDDDINQNETTTLVSQLRDVVQFMTHEPICIWVSLIVKTFI